MDIRMFALKPPYPDESVAPADLLQWAIETFGNRFALSTSFQIEGMVLLDMASKLKMPFRVITVDTGRLPEETYKMIETVYQRYGIRVEIVVPDPAEVEAMVALHGPNLFYREVPMRMLCCRVRKTLPFERKLAELDAYAVGLRRSQNETRASVPKVDASGPALKLAPLADWTREQVKEYLTRNKVPRHPLYEDGYTSIGCAPCTRAPEPGEPERAGRWWWEQDAPKECGLHFTPDGKVERRIDVLLREIREVSQNRHVHCLK
jgi:phosophoadenylyl-sulfate reductase (thioredoxin)